MSFVGIIYQACRIVFANFVACWPTLLHLRAFACLSDSRKSYKMYLKQTAELALVWCFGPRRAPVRVSCRAICK